MNITAINNNLNTQASTPKYQANFGRNIVPKIVSTGYDKFTDKIATGMGKIIDTPAVQNFAKKFHNTNLATHMFSATGILLSSFLIYSISKNDKIEKERKKPLMLNTAISCAISTAGGYTIDKLLEKPIAKFSANFAKQNANNPKLHKYLEGIKIAKSALIFGMLYRFVVPVVSMFIAEKFIENKNNKLNKQA